MSSAMAIPLRDVPGGNKASKTIDSILILWLNWRIGPCHVQTQNSHIM